MAEEGDDPDARLGRLVDDRYKILEAMASGAMGAVYKAERVPVGKLVAIKFLHKSYAKDSEFLIRFERETRVMSKLTHPNCVSVVDFGMWEDAPYLVMDFVAGTTLRALLDHERIEPVRALVLARQIAAGLAHAHAQGIVHRDIKPANIMITDEIGTGEHVRLLDFGLARLRGGGPANRDATQTNVVVGTPNYMSPEQTVPGMTVDARADVYAMGVVLYEMLAGERPFSAPDTLALLGMHRAAPIPRLADRVDDPSTLPDGVQAVIDTAMAKSPDDRYQSAVELAAAIDGVLDAGRPEALRAGASGSRPTRRAVTSPTAAGVAPTLVDEVRPRAPSPPPAAVDTAPPHRSSWRRSLILAVILLGSIAGGAAALIHLNAIRTGADDDRERASGAAVVAPTADADFAAIAAPTVDAPPEVAVTPTVADAADVVAVGSDLGAGSAGAAVATAGSADVAPAGSAVAAVANGSDLPAGSATGSGSADIEIDPTIADNPIQNPNVTATEEAADAPRTAAEAAHKAAPAPADPLATTVTDAVAMIKDGKHTLALHSLLALYKKAPKSSYIPFLLGNLYYDQLWWGIAMDNYREAIAHNGQYRGNEVLNRNVIRMLASDKTRNDAAAFLKKTIGKPAVRFLTDAAKVEPNSTVRKQAANLAKQLR
jgi:serine/threonine-protein kinase